MGVDGTYALSAQAGGKTYKGTAHIASHANTVQLSLDAPILGAVKAQGTLGPNDTFSVSGKVRVLLKRITYTIEGQVEGDHLSATASTNMGTFRATGVRVER